MGFQDREYFRETDDTPPGYQLGGNLSLTTKLVILTVAVFALDAFTHPVVMSSDGKEIHSRALGGFLALRSNLADEPWHAWRLLSYGFAHAPLGSDRGLWHIAMNMFALWSFGAAIERRYGKWEYLSFYLVSLVLCGLVWVAAHTLLYHPTLGSWPGAAPAARLIGASGGVTAVVILYVCNFPRSQIFFWGVLGMPAWLLGVIYVGLDLLGALSRDDNVAYGVHLTGAALALGYWGLNLRLTEMWPSRWFGWLRGRPRLKVRYGPTPPEETPRDLETRADAILEKMHREGADSLTREERRVLEAYSRRMRQKHG